MNKRHVVVVTNLYPNRDEINRGIFTKQQVEGLNHEVDVTVIAPVPWRPIWLEKAITKRPALPKMESIDGITVYHPRYLVIPKILRWTYGWFFYLGVFSLIKSLSKKINIDLISVHWAYPDAYGTALAANRLHIPFAVHALGCDINEYLKYPARRKRIKYAMQHSKLNIVVSRELKTKITQLDVSESKTQVLLNGIDQRRFTKGSQYNSRRDLSLPENEKLVLFIGNFQVEKGLTYLLQAVEKIKDSDFRLVVIGGGPDEILVKEEFKTRNIMHKIIFIGRVPHHEIPNYLRAADLLCLPSLREGCPNVVLESLSCGTPVLGSNVGAVPDIISKPQWGIVVPTCSPEKIANGILSGLTLKEQGFPEFKWFSWDDNAKQVLRAYAGIYEPG